MKLSVSSRAMRLTRFFEIAVVGPFLLPAFCYCQSAYTGCNGQPATGELQLAIASLSSSTGIVQVNGADTRGPDTPFTWTRGDGATTQGFFPQSHTYSDLQRNYTLQVTSHENDGSSDCAQLAITFATAPPATGTTGGLGFLPPVWQPIGPTKIPNAHACDNGAEASLLAAGKIQAFAIDFANPSLMYAGGGVGPGNSGPASNGGVYESTDGGVHWVAKDNGLTDAYVDSLWLDQSNPNILLATTWFGGIFRSTDGGQTWSNVRNSPTTSIVQVGTVILAAAADGVVASSDFGATWVLQKPTASPVRALTCAAGACYAGLDDGSILAQATPSSPWLSVLPGAPGTTAWDIAVSPNNPSEAIVVLNNAGSLQNLISQNGGASWTPFSASISNCAGSGEGQQSVAQVVAFDSVNANTIYGDFGGAIWVTLNGGTSWTPLHLYEDARMIYPLPGQAGNVVVGGDQGIYLSRDGGTTWTSLNGDLTTSLLTHLAVDGAEVFTAVQDFSPILSFDGGNSWLQLSGSKPPAGEDGVVAITPGDAQYQYAFTTGGFWYSSDGGNTFTNDNVNLPYTEFGFGGTTDYIAIDPSNSQHLYVVGNDGVFESADYGVHWRATGWPVPAPTFVVMDPNNSKTIFAGSGGLPPQPISAVYFTHDGGLTWQQSSLPTNAQWPVSLAVDPTDSSTVILGMTLPPGQSGGGILLSTDGGKTFSSDNQGLLSYPSASQHYVWSVRFAPATLPHVVAAATTSGLYVSRAGGPWTDITGNAVPRWFSAVTWTADSIYAATFGEGVLKSSISGITPISSINPTSASVSGAGGTGSVAVVAFSGSTAWTVSSAVAWVTVTSGSSGMGNGTVNYLVDANPSTSPRTGTIMIGGFSFTISQAGATPGSGVSIAGITSAASYAAGQPVAAGSIAAVFGTFPLGSQFGAVGLPLPASLGGLAMAFNGVAPVPLFYAAGGQVNIEVPWELAGQTQASLSVTFGGQTGGAQTVNLAPYAPGIFTTNSQGTGQGAILDSSFRLVDSSNPAIPGSTYIQIFCTGLGPVTNQPADGASSPTNPLSETTATPTVTIGGVEAPVQFSGLTPGLVGVYQVNVQVPAGTPAGNAVLVVVSIGGATSNTATIAVAASSLASSRIAGISNSVLLSGFTASAVEPRNTLLPLQCAANPDCFSIQQNFFISTGRDTFGSNGPLSGKFSYWAQNVVVVHKDFTGQTSAWPSVEVFTDWPTSRHLVSAVARPAVIELPATVNLTATISAGGLALLVVLEPSGIQIASVNFPFTAAPCAFTAPPIIPIVNPCSLPLLDADAQIGVPSEAPGSTQYVSNTGAPAPPELVPVGPAFGGYTTFSDPTAGSVTSNVQLGDGSNAAALQQVAVLSGATQTGETEYNLTWQGASGTWTAGNSATFQVSPALPAYAAGIWFEPVN